MAQGVLRKDSFIGTHTTPEWGISLKYESSYQLKQKQRPFKRGGIDREERGKRKIRLVSSDQQSRERRGGQKKKKKED